MDRSLDRMTDHLIQPGTTSGQIGEILAGAATWQYLSPYNPRVREGDDVDPSIISKEAEALLDLLIERDIDFVLVGAVAMLQYIPGRNTLDIDFIMAASELGRCPEIIVHEQDKDFLQGRFRSVGVDLLLTDNRLFTEVANSHSQILQIGERLMKCATPTGLVILKLYAIPSLLFQFQEGKIRKYESDVEGLLSCEISDEVVVTTLKKHLKPGELLAVKTVLQDLRSRISTRREWMEEFHREMD